MTLSMPARSFSFGPFKLVAEQQRLLRNDSPIRLGSRALAILSMLLERAGELVSKQDLMSRGWPDTFVDESNLKVNIAALRKTLDEGDGQPSHIVNVSGRGYRFVAPVSVTESENSLERRRRPRTV
jgi:DNA-binding winged helix-turn-helix (wHTH) protein